MRIDDLNFMYDEEIYSLVSGLEDIDVVIQPVNTGFLAEVVDGTTVHMLGEFVSERWAKVSALEKAMEILQARDNSSSVDLDEDADEDDPFASMTAEDVRDAVHWALDILPAFWRWSESKDRAPSGN